MSFLVSKQFFFFFFLCKIIRFQGKSIRCKMKLLNGINSNKKSCQQGNGDLISDEKLTALVVDSDIICQVLEKAILESQGIQAQVVGSGRDAIDLLASGVNFDLIIIAMVLPIMNGVEVSLSTCIVWLCV